MERANLRIASEEAWHHPCSDCRRRLQHCRGIHGIDGRRANGQGFNIVLALDLMMHMDAEIDESSVKCMFAQGEAGSLAQIMAVLGGRQR
ncbi:MAG: hypothetical protein ABI268_09005 [Rhodanobacter sp.]